MRQHESESQDGTQNASSTTQDQPTSSSNIPLTYPAYHPTVSRSPFPSFFRALSGNDLIAFFQEYCDIGFPTNKHNLLCVVKEIGRFWAWGARFLPLTRSPDPLIYNHKPQNYALATCFPKAKSVNDTTAPGIRIRNEILRDVTFYMPTGVKKIRCVCLGRLILANRPTYWIVFMDAGSDLYALRGDDVDEEDIEFCFGEIYERSRNENGDHVCPWKEDKNMAVFGDFNGLLAVKLGKVLSFMDAQIRGNSTLVVQPIQIFRWSSVLVPEWLVPE